MGAIVHGRAAYTYTYTDSCQMGNNVTMDVLHYTLVDQLRKCGKLPPVLFLQLDNTSRQCKGRFLMGYLGYLVQQKVFSKIVLSFLPVGHTHEDIDQLFSRISVALRKNKALDREQMGKVIVDAWKQSEMGQVNFPKHSNN